MRKISEVGVLVGCIFVGLYVGGLDGVMVGLMEGDDGNAVGINDRKDGAELGLVEG